MKNSDMPASPLTGDAYTDFAHYDGTNNTSYNPECQGLTKREAFAMAAMQNILSQYNPYESGDFDSSDYHVASAHAVGLADSLLAELEKTQGDK